MIWEMDNGGSGFPEIGLDSGRSGFHFHCIRGDRPSHLVHLSRCPCPNVFPFPIAPSSVPNYTSVRRTRPSACGLGFLKTLLDPTGRTEVGPWTDHVRPRTAQDNTELGKW